MALAKTASSYCTLSNLLAAYKDKLIASLKSAAKKKKNLKDDLVLFVDAFPLKFEEISNLLNLTSSIPSASLIVQSGENLKFSQWWYLTAHLLSRVTDLRNKGNSNVEDIMILQPSIVSHVSNWVLHLLPNENVKSDCIAQALLDYITSCPQHMAHIPDVSVL